MGTEARLYDRSSLAYYDATRPDLEPGSNSMESRDRLLINLSSLPLAGIWYQWLTVICALSYREIHRDEREIVLLSPPELDKTLLRLAEITLPRDADTEQLGRKHHWQATSGIRAYDAFKASIPIRRSLYEKLRIGDESRAAQAIIDKIGRPFSCLIARGIPSVRGAGVPLLCIDSVYYTRLIGETNLDGLAQALNFADWPAEARHNPVVVCGDAYEDAYADYLRTQGLEVYTKDRSALIGGGMDVNGLALVDFLLALESICLFGLCTSALYFAAREARLYLRGNLNSWEYVLGQPTDFKTDRNVITPIEWAAQVLVCDLIEDKYPIESCHADFQKGPALVRDLQKIAATWAAQTEHT